MERFMEFCEQNGENHWSQEIEIKESEEEESEKHKGRKNNGKSENAGDGNPLYSLIFILYEQSINLGCKEADKDGNACRHEGAKYSPSEAS